MTASWIELNAAALHANIAVFRKVLGAARVGAVLKANAYGHGLVEVLPLVHARVDAIYVIAPADGLRIRDEEKRLGLGSRQVIVIGAIAPEEHVELARQGIDVVLADHGWPAAADASDPRIGPGRSRPPLAPSFRRAAHAGNGSIRNRRDRACRCRSE